MSVRVTIAVIFFAVSVIFFGWLGWQLLLIEPEALPVYEDPVVTTVPTNEWNANISNKLAIVNEASIAEQIFTPTIQAIENEFRLPYVLEGLSDSTGDGVDDDLFFQVAIATIVFCVGLPADDGTGNVVSSTVTESACKIVSLDGDDTLVVNEPDDGLLIPEG